MISRYDEWWPVYAHPRSSKTSSLWFQTYLKNFSQIGSRCQVGVKIEHSSNQHLDIIVGTCLGPSGLKVGKIANEPTRLDGLEPGEPVNFQKGLIRPVILLMLQKSGDHLLRLVVYPIIYKVLYIVWDFWTINRMWRCYDILQGDPAWFDVDFLATLSDVCQRKSRAFKIQMIANENLCSG